MRNQREAQFPDSPVLRLGRRVGPGISSVCYYGYYDGLMHVYEGRGRDYGGNWKAQGNPLLDYQYTYAFCSAQI